MQKVHRSACAIFLSGVSKGPKQKTQEQNQGRKTQSKNTKTEAKRFFCTGGDAMCAENAQVILRYLKVSLRPG